MNPGWTDKGSTFRVESFLAMFQIGVDPEHLNVEL